MSLNQSKKNVTLKLILTICMWNTGTVVEAEMEGTDRRKHVLSACKTSLIHSLLDAQTSQSARQSMEFDSQIPTQENSFSFLPVICFLIHVWSPPSLIALPSYVFVQMSYRVLSNSTTPSTLLLQWILIVSFAKQFESAMKPCIYDRLCT